MSVEEKVTVLPENISVGIRRDALTVQVTPTDGQTPNKAMMGGIRAMNRYLLCRKIYGAVFDHVLKDHLVILDESFAKPWVVGGPDWLRMLSISGLQVQYDPIAVQALQQSYRREQAEYSRWLPQEDGTWNYYPGSIESEDKKEVIQILENLGWKNQLFNYALDSIAEMGTKRDVLIAHGVGLGKTRSALLLSEVYAQKGAHGLRLIIGAKRHLQSWFEEFDKLPLFSALYNKPYSVWMKKTDKPDYSRPFLILSFERLVRLNDDEIAELQKRVKDGIIVVDEVYLISNKNTIRSRFLNKLSGKHHIALSGTTIKTKIMNFLPIAHWVFRGGSSAFPWYDLRREGAERKFKADYVTVAVADDGSRKEVPVLKNEDQFFRMVSPLISRRLRSEPPVVETLGDIKLERHRVDILIDDEHRTLYRAALKQFTEWYIRELEARGDPGKFPPNELLVKLGYLVRAVSRPWKMKNPTPDDPEFHWPTIERKPTAIHRWAMDFAAKEWEEELNKSIIFGAIREPLDLMAEMLNEAGTPTAVIHGDIPYESRLRAIDAFRNGDIAVLCASYGTLAEGINLKEGRNVIITEAAQDWSPSTVEQAIGRITRAGRTTVPHAWLLCAQGTTQEYQMALAAMKQMMMDAALDGVRQDTKMEIPDVQQYCLSLVGVESEEQVQGRLFEVDFDIMAG